MTAVKQMVFMVAKRGYQLWSIVNSNEKSIGLGLVKLKDIVEPLTPLIKMFEYMYTFDPVWMIENPK